MRLNLRRRVLHRLTGYLQCRIIKVAPGPNSEPEPYLERYRLLELPLGAKVYIHRFLASDPDRGYHNHPWNSISFPLVGGYLEHRFHPVEPVERAAFPGGYNRIRQENFHRVDLLGVDAWTLFFRAGTGNGWGFIYKAQPYGGDWKKDRAEGFSWWQFQVAREVTDSDSNNGWDGIPLGKHTGREPIRLET